MTRPKASIPQYELVVDNGDTEVRKETFSRLHAFSLYADAEREVRNGAYHSAKLIRYTSNDGVTVLKRTERNGD